MEFRGCILHCLSALIAAGSLLAGDVPAAAKREWIDGASAHFRFFSEGSDRTARPVAKDFETLREVLRSMSPEFSSGTLKVNAPLPTYVYLFSNEDHFDAYRSRKEIAGYFSQRPDGNYVALLTQKGDAKRIAFHEYLHSFLHLNFPGVPPWLDEGMAEFYSTMEVEGNEVRLGMPDPGRFRMLRTFNRVPVAQLARMKNVLHSGGEELQQFYASAWLTTHYLIAGDATRRAQLFLFLDLIRAGLPADRAFPRAFECTPEAMDVEIQTYLNLINVRRTIAIWRIDFKKLQVDSTFASRPLNKEQVLARLGLLALSLPEKGTALAESHFQAALTLNPASSPAHFGMGLVKTFGGDTSKGGDDFIKAAESDPDDPVSQFFAGQALFQKAMTSEQGAGSAPELIPARQHLIRSLRLASGQPEAIALLCQTYSLDKNGMEEGLPILEAAVKVLPGRQDLRFNLAIMYLHSKNTEKALPLLREITEGSDELMAGNARRALDGIADNTAAEGLNEGIRLANSGKKAESIPYLEEALRIVRDPDLKRRIQQILDQVNTPEMPAPPPVVKKGKSRK